MRWQIGPCRAAFRTASELRVCAVHRSWTLSLQIRHGTEMGRADRAGVFRQHSAGVTRAWRFPFFQSRTDHTCRNVERDLALLRVDRDSISIPDDCDRPAHVRFRSDMAHYETMAASGKSAVRDERYILAQPLAHDGRSRRQHLAHPRSALWPFVTDHHHVALLH